MKHTFLAVIAAWLLSAGPAVAQDVTPLVHTGVVEAALGEVWRVWTTPAGLQEWLAPHAEIDLRLGGTMRTNYNANGRLGDADTIESTVLSFEPRRMLSTKVAKPPTGFPFARAVLNMWSVLYVDAIDLRHTRVRIVTLGFDKTAESQKMRAFFQQGNAATLRQLQRHFAEAPVTRSDE